MKSAITGLGALLLTAAPALAGGLERAPQSLSVLFEPGNYAELTFGHVKPSVDGVDAVGRPTGNVAEPYAFGGLAYKHQINENLSAAVIVETPFGSDVNYGLGQSAVLGGTNVNVESTTWTGVLRYKAANNVGVHAGLRASRASGDVELRGLGYGQLSGYRASLDSVWGTGWLVGASWEKPEIAARVSLTYQSAIEHDFDTTETLDPDAAGPIPAIPLATGRTKVKTPSSWTLEGQTGIAADTLLFGSIRYVKWSEFKVRPRYFSAIPGLSDGLVSLDDTTTYTIGVGRKFTDAWSGLAAVSYETRGGEPVSPLAPSTGRKALSLGASYTQGPLKVTGLVSYVQLGDAKVGRTTPAGDVVYADMKDNKAIGVGIKVGYSF